MHRGQARKQGKDAADRAQVTTPDALAPGEQQADADRHDRGTAQNQQGGLGVVIHTDQLPVEGGQAERQGRPAAPAHPARHAQAFAVMTGPLAE
ncbi:hypothetical protein D3C80_1460480 [compost metagenome]